MDEAMGNVFSPDPALNFMEEVPPWLDVFLLSQLVIWMVSEGTNKPHNQRPLDWRWVVYPKFSERLLLKVKALTALCSNYSTSPKNASEFKILLETLFPKNEIDSTKPNPEKIIDVLNEIDKGRASEIVRFAEARSIIESRLTLLEPIGLELEEEIEKMVAELSANIPISSIEKNSVRGFIKLFQNGPSQLLSPTYQVSFGYMVGDGFARFSFGFSYLLYTKMGIENSPEFRKFENRPCIAFTLNNSDRLRPLTKHYYVLPDDNGTLSLLFDNRNLFKQITVSEIVEITKDSIINPTVWKFLYE
jgi:hypothetical protein